jgi:hypothetical protein
MGRDTSREPENFSAAARPSDPPNLDLECVLEFAGLTDDEVSEAIKRLDPALLQLMGLC